MTGEDTFKVTVDITEILSEAVEEAMTRLNINDPNEITFVATLVYGGEYKAAIELVAKRNVI